MCFKEACTTVNKALRRIAGRGRSLLKTARVADIRRKPSAKTGYYAALALLLVLLGSASHAYRQKEGLSAPRPTKPPRPAVAIKAPVAVEPVAGPTPEPVRWVWPLEGEIVNGYSPEELVWSETLAQWQTHAALDIAGSPGEAVYACREGVVSDAWHDRLWGNVIVLEHDDGYQSTYAGLNTLNLVNPGDSVEAGQVLGAVGETAVCEAESGWHLHFALERNGEAADFQALFSDGAVTKR